MTKKRRIIETVEMPEFETSINEMSLDSKLFVDKAMELAHYISRVMEEKGLKQKDLAEKLGKSEAEISKWLTGMHNFTLRSITKIESALGVHVIMTPKSAHFAFRSSNLQNSGTVNAAKNTVKASIKYGYVLGDMASSANTCQLRQMAN